MAFQSINDLNLSKYLQIVFTRGAMVQVSKSQREWDMVARMRDGNPNGRERRFLFINSLGYAAAQTSNPAFTGAFPAAQKASIAEYTALYKQIDVTVELEYNLWKSAQLTPEKYAEPLAKEIELKAIVARRLMGTHLFGDGTGVYGTISTAADTTSPAPGYVTVTLNTDARGHVRWFQYGDLFISKQPDGSAQATPPSVSGPTPFAYWKVKNILPKTNQVQLQPVSSAGVELPLVASNFASGNVFYRAFQQVIPDLTAVGDYGSATDVMPGLGSLVSNDGRLVHGIQMSGAAAGTVLDWNGSAIDIEALQEGLDEVDMRTGKGEFSYKLAVMAPETRAALIASREDDRRFNVVTDSLRGGKGFGYMHDEDTVIYTPSEFCPKEEIYVLPEGKQDGNKVLSYFGTDYEAVSVSGGNSMMLKPAQNGGFEKNIVSYMQARGTMVCHRPAAVLRIKNFTA